METASFCKLRNGNWGVRVPGKPRTGETVTVQKRNGNRSSVVIESIVWQGDGISLCTIQKSSGSGSSKGMEGQEGPYRSVLEGGAAYCKIGDPCWIRDRGKRIPVVVVGHRSEYVREDGLSFGFPADDGHFTTIFYRDASPEEAAELQAKDEKIKAKREAEKEAKEKGIENFKTLKAELTKGLVKTTCTPVGVKPTEILGKDDSGFYRITLHRASDGGVFEYANGHDDFRSYYWGTPEVIKTAVLAWATKNDITPEKASAWLKKYSNCDGADDYRIVAETAVSGEDDCPF